MSGKKKKRADKSNGKGGRRFRKAIIFFSVAAAVLIAFLLFLMLFHTDRVEVVGNYHYTDEEIRQMVTGGPFSENTVISSVLYRDRKIDGAEFIDHLTVVMTGRHSIRIEVTEKALIGYLQSDGIYWYFDQRGEIMARGGEKEAAPKVEYESGPVIDAEIVPMEIPAVEVGAPEPSEPAEIAPEVLEDLHYVPYVEGLIVPEAALGSFVTAADPEVFNVIALIKDMTNKSRCIPDTVVAEQDGTWTLCYDDVKVLLGNGDYLQIRIAEMAAILPKLGGRSGYLHLENFDGSQNRIIFSPDRN